MSKFFKISNIKLGFGYEPVLIVDLGINHNGNLDKAIYLSDLAIKNGAKIIKHQTHIAHEEMSIEAKKIIPGNSKQNIFKIIQDTSLKLKDEIKLMKYIKSKKAIFISTPFSKAAADHLNKINVPCFKIGSGECNNYPLVDFISKFRKPIILSTGMNDLNSIKQSVKIIKKNKAPLAILHCTNIYPTPTNLVRVKAMLELKKAFPNIPYGLSDHTSSNYTCYSAVALGASVIEKHFTDDKNSKGPDMSASMDPKDLSNMIKGIKIIYNSLEGEKKPVKEELKTIKFAFASVAATKNIKKNEKFTKDNIFPLRPYTGFYKVKDYKKLLGKKANKFIKKGNQLKKKDVK